ncbi:MAG: MerR family transcriptional regulator [Streptosporangiaceae bacterium]|nr:MerR family transcriptional regulator [Streptosporangiaceae bacterium]MBV9857279.1 MerR family transcriptional regulator [Streptosporangiaceae bacterium]
MTQVPDAGLSAGEVARRLGIAVTTVRTWDRRYGLGPSRRDPGRHRRYDRRDLARLELMRRLTIDGVAPAEAARIARDLRDPAKATSGSSETEASGSQAATRLRRAAYALDPATLERQARLALAEGVVPAWTAVFAPALREIGRRHATVSRYIAAEHLLSAAISAALAAVPRPSARPSVLLACAPTELHSLPLEALAAALAERGRASRMLGARVPATVLRDAIVRTGPTAVVLWAHAAITADSGQLAAVRAARPRPPLIAACGPGWASRNLPPGVRTPAGLPEAVSMISQLA